MARKYVTDRQAVRDLSSAKWLNEQAADRFSMAPGQVTEDNRRQLLLMLAGKPRAAPGRALDEFPWAASWSGFIAMTGRQTEDGRLARAVIEQASRRLLASAALSERIPSEGGFLVPETLRMQVMLYVEQALVRPRALVLPMTTLRLAVPVVDNSAEASGAQALGGMTFAITEAGRQITASTATFDRAVLEARKLAGLLQEVPNELVDDGGAAFDSFMTSAVGRGLAFAEDDLFFNGTGVGEPEGLLNAPCAIATTRAASNAVSLTDVANMWTRLNAASMQAGTAVWTCSPKVIGQLATMTETVGSTPVAASVFTLGTAPDGGWRLAGLPLFVTSHQPDLGTTGDLALTDFSWYGIGDRQALMIARSQAGEGFISGTSDFKVTARIDGRWLLRSPVTPSDGSQTTSPVILLHS